jgi:tRNA-dihydrouridine synthase
LDVNYLFRVVAKLSKSERNFIKELRTSKANSRIPRILRIIPPASEEIEFLDFYSIIYMFEFADIINLNMSCPIAENNPN